MRQTTIRANTGRVARRAVRRHRRCPERGAEDIGPARARRPWSPMVRSTGCRGLLNPVGQAGTTSSGHAGMIRPWPGQLSRNPGEPVDLAARRSSRGPAVTDSPHVGRAGSIRRTDVTSRGLARPLHPGPLHSTAEWQCHLHTPSLPASTNRRPPTHTDERLLPPSGTLPTPYITPAIPLFKIPRRQHPW